MVDFGGLIVGLSVLLTSLSVVLLVPLILEFLASAQRTVKIKNKLAGTQKSTSGELLLADLCINGLPVCKMPAQYLMKIPLIERTVNKVQPVLAYRVPGCSSRALAEVFLALSILSALIGYIITGQAFFALLCLAAPLPFVKIKTQTWMKKRSRQLREQLPEALRGLGMCFMAGLSLEQAFVQTAEECRDPLRRELKRTVDDLHTGATVMDSLDKLDLRLGMDEMKFVSVALDIQHRTGGSMREVLDTAADSMQASFDLSRSLEVQTAQARMSAKIVSIMPLVLLVVLSLVMEGYLATFFSSAAGLSLLLCALGMEVVGILIIRRILGLDLR